MMLKCKKCNNKSITFLKYANLRLCKEHFIDFFIKRVKRTIKRYKMVNSNEVVVVAVSGGKDSNSLLHVMSLLRDELNFKLRALIIDLGIDPISEESIKIVKNLCKKLKVELDIFNLKEEFNFTISDIAKNKRLLRKRSICSYCGMVKRYVLNYYALRNKIDKVATGHNLDDIAQAIVSEFFVGNYEQLARIYPISPAKNGLVAKIKPLAETPEKDVMIYALANNIPFVRESCPYARGAKSIEIKHLLNEFEDKFPGYKISLVRNFFKKLRPILVNYYKLEEYKLMKCEICGMPSSTNVCSFCKLRKYLGLI